MNERQGWTDEQRRLFYQGRGGEWTETGSATEYLARWGTTVSTVAIRQEVEGFLTRDERTITQWEAFPPVSPYGQGVCEYLRALNTVRRQALEILEAKV